MLLLLSALAYASCAAWPPKTMVWQHSLAPTTPLHLSSTWADAEDLALRLRVRGPDGRLVAVEAQALGLQIRLVPKAPWQPGVHILEERGDYDTDGNRLLRSRAEVVLTSWFPIGHVEVVHDQPGLDFPDGVEWVREDRGRTSWLMATVPRVPGARWVEVELESAGMSLAARPFLQFGDQLALGSGARVRCNDTGRRLPIPSTGDLHARIIVHGDGGARADGPWTLLGPTGIGSSSGIPTDLGGITSWTSIPASSDPAPVADSRGPCGSLAEVSSTQTEVAIGTALLPDDAGRLHEVIHSGDSGDSVWLDGRQVIGVEGRVLHIGTTAPIRYIAVSGSPSGVSAVRDHRLVAFAPLSGLTKVQSMGVEDTVTVHYSDALGARYFQRLTPSLDPIGPPEKLLHPVQIARGPAGQWAVNGVDIELRHKRRAWTTTEHAVLQYTDQKVGYIGVWSAEGERVLRHPTPSGAWVDDVDVEDNALVVAYSLRGTTVVERVGFDGTVEPAYAVAVSGVPWPPPVAPRRLPHGEQTIVQAGWSFTLEEADGHQTPTVYNPGIVELDHDGVVVARIDPKTTTRHATRYACTGALIGVPPRW